MNKNARLIAVSAALTLAFGTSTAWAAKIGVSMSQFDDNFLTVLRGGMQTHAASLGDVQLQFEDAQKDVGRQLNQMQNFISAKVDAIIVNPVDTASTARISKSALEAGIPLVYVNRRPDQKDLPKGVAAVTSDDEEAGRLQMQYIAEIMKAELHRRRYSDILSGRKIFGGSWLAPISVGPITRKPYIKRVPMTNRYGWRWISFCARSILS